MRIPSRHLLVAVSGISSSGAMISAIRSTAMGLSGRDYSYFTLSFNESQTVKKRDEVCWRLLQFLEHRCRENRNLDVAVQHSLWYDHEKIKKDADRMKYLLAGCSCTYGRKDGKFLFDDGIFCFRPSTPRGSSIVFLIPRFLPCAGNLA